MSNQRFKLSEACILSTSTGEKKAILTHAHWSKQTKQKGT